MPPVMPRPTPSPRPRRLGVAAALAVALTLVGGCGTTSSSGNLKVYQQEQFEPGETFSRMFDASVSQTCEAARRALLSQGYIVTVLRPDAINGSKNFQPGGEAHVQITFNIVCTDDGNQGKLSSAYVSRDHPRRRLLRPLLRADGQPSEGVADGCGGGLRAVPDPARQRLSRAPDTRPRTGPPPAAGRPSASCP
ncbi:MAG: hypothetical protein RL223_2295 [Pseudomonadota bacterium]